jgi:energy-coupling factor transport system substrate-specific component
MNSPLQQGGKSLSVKELVLYAVLSAFLLAVQVGLAFLPNVELVSLLLIIYTRVLGKKALYPLYVFVLAEGLIYGFGIWWINYLYIWTILVLVTLIFKRMESVLFWTVI